MNCPVCKEKEAFRKAFIAAQQEVDTIIVDGTNIHLNYKYPKLGAIYSAVKKPLAKYGLYLSHKIYTENGISFLQTTLMHAESGQYKDDTRIINPQKPDNQGFGAAETYMKKYAVKSLCGIDVGEEDDDGEAERQHVERLKELETLAKYKKSDKDLLKKFNIEKIKDLTPDKLYDALWFVSYGERKKNKKEKDTE